MFRYHPQGSKVREPCPITLPMPFSFVSRLAGLNDAILRTITYQTDFGTSLVVAYVYLPQLLERSSYSQELFDIILNGATQRIHMRSKDIPLGDRLIKPELKELLPNVIKASRAYACVSKSLFTTEHRLDMTRYTALFIDRHKWSHGTIGSRDRKCLRL